MGSITSAIKEAARNLGFEVVGITGVAPFPDGLEALNHWREAGMASGMEYMTRKPELKANPGMLVPSAASLISLAVNHYTPAPAFKHQNRYGRIARYAWGRDYHDVIRPRLIELSREISSIATGQAEENAELSSRSFVDAVPLLERAVANRAGLGFFGKNTNLILPRAGSWYFLAEIFVSLKLPEDRNLSRVSCGSCHKCLDVCPTEAFSAPYKLDANKCISYLTIENKGPIPRDLRSGLGEWLFGCDLCQEVCPFNRFSSSNCWPDLKPEAGPGQKLDLVDLLSIRTDSEYRARFQGTALMRPKRKGMLRNAAVVAANIGCDAALCELTDLAEYDPEPLIRSHSMWAAFQLSGPKALPILERLLKDPDQSVRAEAQAVIDGA